jgi:hypothetical protein
MKMLVLPPQKSEIKQVLTTFYFTSVSLKAVSARTALRDSRKDQGAALNIPGWIAIPVSDEFKALNFLNCLSSIYFRCCGC